jgi:hypothetical protein
VDTIGQVNLVPMQHSVSLVFSSFQQFCIISCKLKSGVAVYYLAPLYSGYAGGVSTLLSLDSGPAQLVNLTSLTFEPSGYAVRWSASGLANGTHTVINALGLSSLGQVAMWAVVDGFMYVRPNVSCPDPILILTKTQLHGAGSTYTIFFTTRDWRCITDHE